MSAIIYFYLYDVFDNRSWIDTQCQLYSAQFKANSKQNNKMEHNTTQ
jgi:hypothetical protein